MDKDKKNKTISILLENFCAPSHVVQSGLSSPSASLKLPRLWGGLFSSFYFSQQTGNTYILHMHEHRAKQFFYIRCATPICKEEDEEY